MDILKLMIVFAVLVVMLWLKRPLYHSWGTLSVLLVFYLITFLQRMLEKRDFLNLAQISLNGIFNNRRINASLAPDFIGLLPSAGAVVICGDIVEKSVGPYLSPEEKTFVTSYFRHSGELPAYVHFHYHCHKPDRGKGECGILSDWHAAAGISSGLSGIPVLPEKDTKGYGDAVQHG